jgi:CO/xanthine dehydrogenase Mo-binding subunit
LQPRPTPVDVPLPNGGGLRNAIPYYVLPALEVRHHFIAEGPIRTSALRSLGAHANVFAIESFMDELADAAGLDPLVFRLLHLADDRARHVCEAVARLARWSDRPAGGDGQGFGFGFARYKNRAGYLAVVVEIVVDEGVRVRHVWAVADAGAIVHRDGLLNQIEGGILQALSWSLKESVRWGPRGLLSTTWDDYPILTFAELPEVVIELVDRFDEPSLGAGELAPGPVAGALGNAVAHALGVRARHLPLAPDRLLALVHAAGDDSVSPG